MTRSKMFISIVSSFVILHVVVGAALLVPCSQAQGNDSQVQANNGMFPAQPAAASSIGWQGNYFVVRGRPTILWSGSIHYARIPRELWRERLVEAKRAGINTIQTYVFWNAHEPQSDVFDFSDNLDRSRHPVQNAPTTSPASVWNWDARTKVARATFTYPDGDTITELPLGSGDGASATFLVVNTRLVNRTWITDRAIFVGATNVTEDLSVDVPPAGAKVTIYSSRGRKDIAEPARSILTTPPAFGDWRWRDAALEAAPGYDDSRWATSTQPEAFGIYGFQNGYGWYRAKFTASAAGIMSFNIANVTKFAMVFVNGEQVQLNNQSGSLNAIEGENTIAILAWHNGIDTIPIGKPTPDSGAGIWGGVTKSGGEPLATTWRFRGGLGAMEETAVIGRVTNWPNFLSGDWAGSATGNRPSFWMTTIKSPLQAGAFVTVGLNTKGLSLGSVWVNGHNIGRFSGETLLYVPECWLAANNTVVIYDVSGNSPTNVQLQYIEKRARYATTMGTVRGGVHGLSSR